MRVICVSIGIGGSTLHPTLKKDRLDPLFTMMERIPPHQRHHLLLLLFLPLPLFRLLPRRLATMVRQEVLLLDISSDPSLVSKYIDHHAPGNMPKSIVDSIRYPGSGVLNMRIFNFADRLVMIMDVEDDFSFESKAASDGSNPEVESWESLMAQFQREIVDPTGQQTGKWKRTQLCFDLSQHK